MYYACQQKADRIASVGFFTGSVTQVRCNRTSKAALFYDLETRHVGIGCVDEKHPRPSTEHRIHCHLSTQHRQASPTRSLCGPNGTNDHITLLNPIMVAPRCGHPSGMSESIAIAHKVKYLAPTHLQKGLERPQTSVQLLQRPEMRKCGAPAIQEVKLPPVNWFDSEWRAPLLTKDQLVMKARRHPQQNIDKRFAHHCHHLTPRKIVAFSGPKSNSHDEG